MIIDFNYSNTKNHQLKKFKILRKILKLDGFNLLVKNIYKLNIFIK